MTTTSAATPRTVHIVEAHLTYPDWSEGGLNAAMADLAAATFTDTGHRVTRTRIETGYEPDREVQRYVDADLVVLQTPINWFGAPWIYKRYVDDVFNAGLHSRIFLDDDGRTRSDPERQYGTGGHMHGRGFMISATWNAPLETFDNSDSVLLSGKGVDDVLLSISSNYRFVGFQVLESFGLFDIYHSDSYRDAITAYPELLSRRLSLLA